MAGESEDGGWFHYAPGHENAHLTDEQRSQVERLNADASRRRGDQIARVVVDIFVNEAVPQVQILASDIDMSDARSIAAIVARASVALADWR